MSLPWLHVYIIINLYNYYIINYGYSSSVDFGNFKIYLLSNFVVCAPLNPTLYNARCAGRKFMRKNKSAEIAVRLHGGDILASHGMQLERGFYQHGSVSVYDHSFAVAVMCVRLSRFLRIRTDLRALVRGALLHDYFLYDWHIPDESHRLHAFTHPRRALINAGRDFGVDGIQKNMILSHMFPLSTTLPRCRESMFLCAADKICTVRETFAGVLERIGRKGANNYGIFRYALQGYFLFYDIQCRRLDIRNDALLDYRPPFCQSRLSQRVPTARYTAAEHCSMYLYSAE